MGLFGFLAGLLSADNDDLYDDWKEKEEAERLEKDRYYFDELYCDETNNDDY